MKTRSGDIGHHPQDEATYLTSRVWVTIAIFTAFCVSSAILTVPTAFLVMVVSAFMLLRERD